MFFRGQPRHPLCPLMRRLHLRRLLPPGSKPLRQHCPLHGPPDWPQESDSRSARTWGHTAPLSHLALPRRERPEDTHKLPGFCWKQQAAGDLPPPPHTSYGCARGRRAWHPEALCSLRPLLTSVLLDTSVPLDSPVPLDTSVFLRTSEILYPRPCRVCTGQFAGGL